MANPDRRFTAGCWRASRASRWRRSGCRAPALRSDIPRSNVRHQVGAARSRWVRTMSAAPRRTARHLHPHRRSRFTTQRVESGAQWQPTRIKIRRGVGLRMADARVALHRHEAVGDSTGVAPGERCSISATNRCTRGEVCERGPSVDRGGSAKPSQHKAAVPVSDLARGWGRDIGLTGEVAARVKDRSDGAPRTRVRTRFFGAVVADIDSDEDHAPMPVATRQRIQCRLLLSTGSVRRCPEVDTSECPLCASVYELPSMVGPFSGSS